MTLSLQNIIFENPYWMILLAIIPLLYWWRKKMLNNKIESVAYSSIPSELVSFENWKTKTYKNLHWLIIAAYTLMVIAMARPQKVLTEEVVKAEAIDIMMVMDLSSSMLSQDFEPNRLEVSKQVALEFVAKRKYDRIGLVVFAGESYTQCPLTTDHKVVESFLKNFQIGLMTDGTAIGMGLGTAVNRLKDSDTKSKIIILLTDGVNNAGYINPYTASDIAKEYNVKVYTIAIGTQGQALSPIGRDYNGNYVFDYARVELDEKLLQDIAKATDGKYFRAIDRKSLEDIYAEIDKLEKTEIEVNSFKRYTDLYPYFLWSALSLLILYWVGKMTIFKLLSW